MVSVTDFELRGLLNEGQLRATATACEKKERKKTTSFLRCFSGKKFYSSKNFIFMIFLNFFIFLILNESAL